MWQLTKIFPNAVDAKFVKKTIIKIFKYGENVLNYENKVIDLCFTKKRVPWLKKPNERSYLIVSNHQSSADISSLLVVLAEKTDVIFVANERLRRGLLMKYMIMLTSPIFFRKQSTKSGVLVIKKAINTLQNKKKSVFVFPEGEKTYSKQMIPFAKSPFLIAHKAKAPILPITIKNADQVSIFGKEKTQIKIIIHKPMEYRSYKHLSLQETADTVQKTIGSLL